MRFGHTSDYGPPEKHGQEVVVLLRPRRLKNTFGESVVKADSTDHAEIEQFIKDNYHGQVGHRTNDNTVGFKAPLVIAFCNVNYVKNPKNADYWCNHVMDITKSVTGQGVRLTVLQHSD